MARPVRAALFAGISLLLVNSPRAADPEPDPLPRRGLFGAQVEPVSAEARKKAGVGEGVGVLVRAVIPGTTASDLGVKAGDVITSVNDQKVTSPPQFVGLIVGRKAEEPLTVALARDGKTESKTAALKGRPRETADGLEVVYGSVMSRGHRLRTILTKPKGAEGKKLPAFYIIQGLGSFSVEDSPPGAGPYARYVAAFAKRGWVTFRVEKPGQGDSEGGPTRDADFEAELDGYRQGLKALKAQPFVDADRVVIFGHSMGGVMAPLIAADDPVRGIAAYGTAASTWHEYLLANTRRQLALAGQSAAEIDQTLRLDASLQTYLYAEGLSPAEILAKHPELKGRLDETVQDDRYVFGRTIAFFRQLAAANLPAAWSKFKGHALAAWGTADFVSAESDHALIAAVVNAAHPGHGTFLAVQGSDHTFQPAESFEASFRRGGSPSGEFNPAFLDALTAWADRVTAMDAR